MKTKMSRGLALTELLVVIATIAILAAILSPVFGTASDKARQTACLSNLNQIARASMMYLADNGGGFVPLVSVDWLTTWPEILLPYVRDVWAFGCPSAYVPQTAAELDYTHSGRLSYGMNTTVFNYPWSFPVSVRDIEYPSQTVFVCGSTGANWISLPGGTHWNYMNEAQYGPGYACRPPADRHNTMINSAFVDGHARAMVYTELIKTIPNTQGRKVAYIDASFVGHWTSLTTMQVFPYFAVSANYPSVRSHF